MTVNCVNEKCGEFDGLFAQKFVVVAVQSSGQRSVSTSGAIIESLPTSRFLYRPGNTLITTNSNNETFSIVGGFGACTGANGGISHPSPLRCRR
jgi:hypothetical protein